MRDVAEILLIRGLFLLFLKTLYRAAFCRFLAIVSEAKPRLRVYFASLYQSPTPMVPINE